MAQAAVYIVTDLGYGDAGKGTTVDTLTRQRESTVVVRHNGGPQAGHNVVTTDGRHHEFAQFGSGSLVPGTKTMLSKHMLINPLNMMLEADHLVELGQLDIWDRTYVDLDCIIITPWHIAINRLLENARGRNRHGSCAQGVGIAAQEAVEHDPQYTLRVRHLGEPALDKKLDRIREHLAAAQAAIPRCPDGTDPNRQVLADTDLVGYLAQRYRQWYDNVRKLEPNVWLGLVLEGHEQVIFEGAQGVLLDEWYGWHPYTTWSTTTPLNARMLLQEAGYAGPIQRLGVTRAYMVRHGPGPFVTEDPRLKFIEPHNPPDVWRGAIRYGPLDLVALRYAAQVCGGMDQLVVTHLDRQPTAGWQYCDHYVHDGGRLIGAIPVGRRGNLRYQAELTTDLGRSKPVCKAATEDQLLGLLETHIAPVWITSRGPTAADKRFEFDHVQRSA